VELIRADGEPLILVQILFFDKEGGEAILSAGTGVRLIAFMGDNSTT
jgi:hypothetical protein